MKTANTILAQLGGNRFLAMTGAKNLIGDTNSLMFDLPRGTKNKANKVRVTLDPSDTYRVEFFRFAKLTLNTLSKAEGVFVENLREVFTDATGLHCTL